MPSASEVCWYVFVVSVPGPDWHLHKPITKALCSKAQLGGPWQWPHVPDYTNVCQPTLSTCRAMHEINQPYLRASTLQI